MTKITRPLMPSAKIKPVFNINQICIIGRAFKDKRRRALKN